MNKQDNLTNCAGYGCMNRVKKPKLKIEIEVMTKDQLLELYCTKCKNRRCYSGNGCTNKIEQPAENYCNHCLDPNT